MPPVLQSIVIENFKSFKGRHVIGPFNNFTGFLGPNGAGKSNVVDALGFVLGETLQSLRVQRLNALINRSHVNELGFNTASVTAIFKMPDNSCRSFCRTIEDSNSTYKINDDVVKDHRYLTDLKSIGLNSKAKNFIVFQGTVESIAMKSPKQMTDLLEEICGSGALKKEYENLRAKMTKAKVEASMIFNEKKQESKKTRDLEIQKTEANKYEHVLKDVTEKEVEYNLFRLFHSQMDITFHQQCLEGTNRSVKVAEGRIVKVEAPLKNLKKEHGKLSIHMAKIDQQIRELEIRINQTRPTIIETMEKTSHVRNKLSTARKSLWEATKACKSNEKTINNLNNELQMVDQQRQEYESEYWRSQSQSQSVQLDEAQMLEYKRLKLEAQKQCLQYQLELDAISRDLKAEQDRLDNELRVQNDLKTKIKLKTEERAQIEKRVRKLNDYIRISEQTLKENETLKENLFLDVTIAKNQEAKLKNEIESISAALRDAKLDKHEEIRSKEKAEVIDKLKNRFSGIYGRIVNLCHPTSKKYNVAVTKVLGKHMESIVVDTEKTARVCIQFLKDNMFGPETFLPLDNIKAPPLKYPYWEVPAPGNSKLLYDVLNYDQKEICEAVKFVTNNVVVCETAEDAMAVAFASKNSDRCDAVALDGTFYRKSGLISGGRLDLAKKASRWDEKEMGELKSQKENLTRRLQETIQMARKESEIESAKGQIRELTLRIKIAKADKKIGLNQIKTLHEELEALKENLEQTSERLKSIENSMKEHQKNIGLAQSKMNGVEDGIFENFCRDIGVRDIRRYEKEDLVAQQEFSNKINDFESHRLRILSQLEFEKSKDLIKNIERWEKVVAEKDMEFQYRSFAEIEMKRDFNKLEGELKTQLYDREDAKKNMDSLEKRIATARKNLDVEVQKLKEAHKRIADTENKLEADRALRQSLLLHCKMNKIKIPMESGKIEDLIDEFCSSGSSPTQKKKQKTSAKIDYSKLEESYKENREGREEVEGMLACALEHASSILQQTGAPNLKAMLAVKNLQNQRQKTNEDWEKAMAKAKDTEREFEIIKKQRREKLTECIDIISDNIDRVYKDLTGIPAAQAFIGSENPEEPYLGGIIYNCVVPGKRFLPMADLSGGERTVAALALLFAIRCYRPAPFFIFDEVDGFLDPTNREKVSSYIRRLTETEMQVLAVSHSEDFLCQADKVFGFLSSGGENVTSRVIALNLSSYLL